MNKCFKGKGTEGSGGLKVKSGELVARQISFQGVGETLNVGKYIIF
jgi:hypothetical protein